MMSTPLTDKHVCKICFLTQNPFNNTVDLIAPCNCKGSIKYVHKTCLQLWRFKGKYIREIKTCEQCLCNYNLGDYQPHSVIVGITTIITISAAYFVISTMMNSFYELFSLLVDEKERVLSWKSTLIIIIATYSFMCCWKFWVSVNFFFTVFRVHLFGFFVDKVVLVGFMGYYVYHLYEELYAHIDAMFVFLCNYRC